MASKGSRVDVATGLVHAVRTAVAPVASPLAARLFRLPEARQPRRNLLGRKSVLGPDYNLGDQERFVTQQDRG